jgi:hypothetical protein
MSFTFSSLKTSIADFLNRDDLTAVIPTFITLAEADFNRRIRHYEMEKRAVAPITTKYSEAPENYLESVRLQIIDGGTFPVELASNAQLMEMRRNVSDTAGRPAYYLFIDGNFEMFPTPDQTYQTEMIFYEKIPALSDTATSNWILASHPDLYLYSSLTHSAPYLGDDARIQVWSALAERALNEITNASHAAKYNGTGLRLRHRGMAPANRRSA